jgi:hypothetical protein
MAISFKAGTAFLDSRTARRLLRRRLGFVLEIVPRRPENCRKFSPICEVMIGGARGGPFMSACPSREQLALLLEDHLNASGTERITSHVQACALCQKNLDGAGVGRALDLGPPTAGMAAVTDIEQMQSSRAGWRTTCRSRWPTRW